CTRSCASSGLYPWFLGRDFRHPTHHVLADLQLDLWTGRKVSCTFCNPYCFILDRAGLETRNSTAEENSYALGLAIASTFYSFSSFFEESAFSGLGMSTLM